MLLDTYTVQGAQEGKQSQPAITFPGDRDCTQLGTWECGHWYEDNWGLWSTFRRPSFSIMSWWMAKAPGDTAQASLYLGSLYLRNKLPMEEWRISHLNLDFHFIFLCTIMWPDVSESTSVSTVWSSLVLFLILKFLPACFSHWYFIHCIFCLNPIRLWIYNRIKNIDFPGMFPKC